MYHDGPFGKVLDPGPKLFLAVGGFVDDVYATKRGIGCEAGNSEASMTKDHPQHQKCRPWTVSGTLHRDGRRILIMA